MSISRAKGLKFQREKLKTLVSIYDFLCCTYTNHIHGKYEYTVSLKIYALTLDMR
jgi:hypothetical protein